MIPLLIIILVLLVYLFISFLYCKKMYLSKKVEKDQAKSINKAYNIATFIFAFVILSKFAFEQTIKDFSFDSSFIINNYIVPIIEKKTLTVEIILSILVFIVFIFNVYILPRLLKTLYKPTKEKYLNTIYNPEIIYNILPEAKLRNCIYSKAKKENETINDLIKTFKSLYIAKKVYLDSSRNQNIEISKRVLNFESDIINDEKDFVLLGDAGCGKSTLLFKTFIDIIEDNPFEKKIIPTFIDLKSINNDNSLVNEIINKNTELFLYNESLKYYTNNNKNINEKEIFLTIFKQLVNDKYKFIFMLDSLDECSKKTEVYKDFKELISLLDEHEANYKFVVALRKSAYEPFTHLFNNYLAPFSVYKVRDYDKSEIKTYKEKLLQQGKIKESDIDDIYRNIEIVTFDEKVNPFIVSMIVNGFISKRKNVFKTKVVEILKDNITRLILDVNESRCGSLQYNEKTYEIIGATTAFKDTIISFDAKKYSTFINSNTAYNDYTSDLDKLKNNTYLVDPDGYFYQKIFGDYYCASFLINTIKVKNNSNNEEYLKLIDEIFTNGHYLELFEYLILLTDNNDLNLENSSLDVILNYFFNKYHESKDETLFEAIFEKFKIMLKALAKYSSKKIVKDKLPLNINATSNSNEVITYLYKKYFEFLINENKEIDYGYFYHLVSIVDSCNLAVKAILKLNDTSKQKKMLSIVRDSYLNLNYQNNIILFYKQYEFDRNEKDEINKIITNNKNIDKLSLRELLDLSFYNDYALDYKELNIDLSKRYFPTIYNLDLFILNYDNKKDLISSKVIKKDKLLFDSESNYNSIKFINAKELAFSKINLDNNVLSLFIYCDDYDVLSNNIKNSENIRSIDIDEGIKTLSENCFNKSINLKNIILPITLIDIQDFALYECHHLQSLNIPDSVTNLGESFIEDCFNLLEVQLPKSLKSMGQYAFEDDTSLSIINFKNVNIELKEGLFKGCMSLKDFNSLNLSKETTIIPKQLFLECINLQEVDLSSYDKLESIGSYAFARCHQLSKVILPSSLKEIKMLCFYKCESLSEVIFNSIPTCSRQVFANLDHKVKIIFNLTDKKIEKVIETNDQFNELITSLNGSLIDDLFIDGIVLESKGNNKYALDYCFNYELKEFKVDDYQGITITSCNIGALGNIELLNDVIFDENLESLSEWLFEDCYSLYTVNLEKTKITKLDKHIFENCFVLKEVLLPSSLSIIDDYAFENCYELNRITFIGKQVTPNTLTIPSNITYIGECAFHNCKKIEEIIFEGNCKVSSFAFDGLSSLKKVKFSNDFDIKNIEDGAFINCNDINFDVISKKEVERITKVK